MASQGTLPMTAEHQALVLAGNKTTTLRAERFEPGVYAMTDREGGCQGCCEVAVIAPDQVWWTSLDAQQKEALALTEGYSSAYALERALRKLGHKYFQQGKRGLWLHTIKPAQ